VTKLEQRSGALKFFFAVHGIILDFFFCVVRILPEASTGQTNL
jgi:hypothetical protein